MKNMNYGLRLVPAGLLLAGICFPSAASATDSGSLSCERGIVSLGDSGGEIVAKCGPPSFTTRREEKRVSDAAKVARDRTVTEVTVDDWTFNFGPDRFQYRLLLEDGRVTRIESLDYGY